MRPVNGRVGYNRAVQFSHLPGGDIVESGLRDLAASRDSAAADLVLIGAPRLSRLGFDVSLDRAVGAEHRLYLRDLTLTHQPGDLAVARRRPPPDLNGIRAIHNEEPHKGDWRFANVGLPIGYSGSLRIGEGPIRNRGYLGSLSAPKFRHVLELVLHEGTLVEVRDVSREMAPQSERIPETPR